MKTILSFFLLLLPVFLWTQTVDSVAIRQVDSLIQVSRALTAKSDFEQAMKINETAEKIALEKLGRETAAYGSCCFNHGRVLDFKSDSATVTKQRLLTEAESWYLNSKTIREKVLGKEHPDYAQSVFNLGYLYRTLGNYEKSAVYFLEALKIREKVLGKENVDYAQTLHNLGMLYSNMSRYQESEAYYLEALEIREKVLGKENVDYAWTLHNLGWVYDKMGNYQESEAYYLEALEIREKVLSKKHADYAQTLHNLGLLYSKLNNYQKSEAYYLEALSIREKVLGKENLDYSWSLLGLGNLYNDFGQYEKAEGYFLETLSTQEKILGKKSVDYAHTLTNLGILCVSIGQYEKAEGYYLEAGAILEALLGRDHPDYAYIQNNLGVLYMEIGQFEKAEGYYLEAKAIWEKTLGKEHPNYAASLNNLGNLYRQTGQFEKAEEYLLEAKTIWEKILGKKHPNYATSLNNLGTLYWQTDQFGKAEGFFLEAKTIQENNLGKEHPNYATSLNNLGTLYWQTGQFEEAESFYLEAKTIREKAQSKEHPIYALYLYNLANLYREMGRYQKAETFCLELAAVNKRLLEKSLHHLSEQELYNYLTTFSKSQNLILSFTLCTGNCNLGPTCFDNSLFYKGFLLNAANQVKHLALSDSASTEKYNLLKGRRRRLATLYALPIAERDSTLVVDLESKANDLEKDLARTVVGFGEAMQQVNWQDVQAALKPGEAAIEFVHYRYHEKEASDSTMYAALVLRPGDAQPLFISLFEEKQLDSLLKTQGGRRADYVNDLYTMPERGVKPLGQPQKSLYELLWHPLEDQLAETKTIYFSPSGLLHRLNLGAIPINDEVSLADRFHLVELNSTRQLVIPAKVNVADQDAVLYGGILYDMDSTAIAAANQGYNSDLVATRGELAFSYSDSTNRGGTWTYLKSTAKEADKIETILVGAGIKTNTRKGFAATEESFKILGKNKPSPRILHLATHGFFFPDPQTEAPSLGRGLGEAESSFKISDHPMIRSGLILAGGNQAWQTGKPLHPGMEDGILTAYEISQMNLSNTELVVLSACETGLGDIQGNEGVYGLQRAFKIAGAKYLIMSLWQVPDQETSVFMETFYRHWIEGKMTIPDAFRRTQQEMRERFINPYQWAGFVLVE
ncbi:MAG: tetratricopeptide repeat protein [Saprospiraceae bacterium]|nr:tetratricopeptide repeat protein [Saprospiraceae bacterium]